MTGCNDFAPLPPHVSTYMVVELRARSEIKNAI